MCRNAKIQKNQVQKCREKQCEIAKIAIKCAKKCEKNTNYGNEK